LREPAGRIQHAHAREPGFEIQRRLEPQHFAQVPRIVKRRALVVPHDVIGTRHAHDVGDTGRAKQGQQRVHVVLVGLGMVGVADVAAERHAHQLAAELILELGTDDLLAVEQVLGADETQNVLTSGGWNSRATA
jgi:hypothetical protein